MSENTNRIQTSEAKITTLKVAVFDAYEAFSQKLEELNHQRQIVAELEKEAQELQKTVGAKESALKSEREILKQLKEQEDATVKDIQ